MNFNRKMTDRGAGLNRMNNRHRHSPVQYSMQYMGYAMAVSLLRQQWANSCACSLPLPNRSAFSMEWYRWYLWPRNGEWHVNISLSAAAAAAAAADDDDDE
jgi:hypothetical protein